MGVRQRRVHGFSRNRFEEALKTCTETMLRNIAYDCADDDEDGMLRAPSRFVAQRLPSAGDDDDDLSVSTAPPSRKESITAATFAAAAAVLPPTVCISCPPGVPNSPTAATAAALAGAAGALPVPVNAGATVRLSLPGVAAADDDGDLAPDASTDTAFTSAAASAASGGQPASSHPATDLRRYSITSTASGATTSAHGGAEGSLVVDVNTLLSQPLHKLAARLVRTRVANDTPQAARERLLNAVEEVLHKRRQVQHLVGRVLQAEELSNSGVADLAAASTNITMRWTQVRAVCRPARRATRRWALLIRRACAEVFLGASSSASWAAARSAGCTRRSTWTRARSSPSRSSR